MIKAGLPLSLICLLCACVSAQITQPPVRIIPYDPDNAVGIDVYAGDRNRGNPVPAFRGQETVEVRTFGDLPDGQRGEISGASCALDSGVYRARFLSPAVVNVPDYGPNSPALFVRCTGMKGDSGSVTRSATNKTAQDRSAAGAGTGLLGNIIVGAISAVRMNPATDEFGYAPIRIQLN